ncbi:MAG TPA: hypothetical protein VM925_03280 [Labilithrix sp.]|nr:hypothetical protein [Labilithrix sp.]
MSDRLIEPLLGLAVGSVIARNSLLPQDVAGCASRRADAVVEQKRENPGSSRTRAFVVYRTHDASPRRVASCSSDGCAGAICALYAAVLLVFERRIAA